jgi:hypothetical protein
MTISHYRRARYRLAGVLLTAYGLGILGSTSLQAILTHSSVTIVSIVVALAFHGVALYLAPYGEKS